MAKAKVNIPDTNPPMQIIGKNNILNVVNDIQNINIKGKIYKCRLISVSKDLEVLPKWIDKVECFHWIYKFEYLNFTEKGFSIEIDYNDNIIKFTNTTSQ